MSRVRERTIGIGTLELDGGGMLAAVEQRVTIYGEPEPDGANVVLVPHALTGSSRVAQWWPGIVGSGRVLDPERWCVVGINALGGCYGSTGPATVAGAFFPRVTVCDMVRAQARALTLAGIDRVACVAGGSLGGMQALAWALLFPQRVGAAVVLAAHDRHSAMGIALNAVQRDAIAAAPGGDGIRLARKIAMLSYKSTALLERRHGRAPDRNGSSRFDVEGYLEHQASAFERRMDPASYVALTHAMDDFDLTALPTPPGPLPSLWFAGISSDWLFRAQDVRDAADRFALRGYCTNYREIESLHGHDAFLAEPAAFAPLIAASLDAALTACHGERGAQRLVGMSW